MIIFGFFLAVIYFCMPETRDTILLSQKSSALRKLTGQPIYAEHELVKRDPARLWKVDIVRPFVFLFTEPITYLCAGINGFVYGMIFLSNEAFPLVFGPGNDGHGWTRLVTRPLGEIYSLNGGCSSGLVNLTFGAYVVGAVIGFATTPLQEAKYHLACRRLGGSDPEARWWSSLWATVFIPAGLMIAAWTSYSYLPWIAPLIGFTMFGFGVYVRVVALESSFDRLTFDVGM